MAASKIFENLIALQIFEQIDATTKKKCYRVGWFHVARQPQPDGVIIIIAFNYIV